MMMAKLQWKNSDLDDDDDESGGSGGDHDAEEESEDVEEELADSNVDGDAF
jgi:hypothetical protein